MAFRTQKISQMTPKGADLEATDLIEVSTIESGSYVTRSITGQELIDAIPLPPTGLTVGTTPISSGTIGRVLFQGTGNVLQQSSSLFWDSTNNRLGIGTSSPSAILHSVGSITASGAIAIGNYMQPTLVAAANNDVLVGLDIAPTFTNGAFTGVTNFGLRSSINYAGEYNGILIRNTNSTAGVGVSRFALGNNANTLLCGLNAFSSVYGSYLNNSSVLCTFPTSDLILATNFNLANSGTSSIRFFTGGYASGQQRMQIFSTGNVAIGTTTDAGFRLDVNGTARVQNDLTIGSNRYLKAFRWTQDDVNRALTMESNSPYNFDGVNIISLNNNLLNNTKNILNLGLASTVSTQSSSSTDAFNVLNIPVTYNFTGGTHTVKGIYYNPTLTAMVGTTHFAFHSTSGNIRFENLPTSAAGLPAGTLYNNLGVLMIA